MTTFKDNLADLTERFELIRPEAGGVLRGLYAADTVYHCLKCGTKIMALSEERWFDCQHKWIPYRVICGVCKNHWHLHITPCEAVECKC